MSSAIRGVPASTTLTSCFTLQNIQKLIKKGGWEIEWREKSVKHELADVSPIDATVSLDCQVVQFVRREL
jgi:hypothetical protein